jgi:hypothetical protein
MCSVTEKALILTCGCTERSNATSATSRERDSSKLLNSFVAFLENIDEYSRDPPEELRARLGRMQDLFWKEDDNKDSGVADDFWWLASTTCKMRRLFHTQKSHPGMGPAGLRVGDRVCILHGGVVAFVLRPDGDSYQMVGTCYLYGVMQGERRAEAESSSRAFLLR